MNLLRELVNSLQKLLRALSDTDINYPIYSDSVTDENLSTSTNPALNSSTVGALRQLGLIDGNDITGNLSV